MHFDEDMIADLNAVGALLRADDTRYLSQQEALARAFVGRESSLEDIIYDFEVSSVRLEAMMVCKLMPSMERLRIFQDMSLAEPDPELKHWAGIFLRQEHLLKTVAEFARSKNT